MKKIAFVTCILLQSVAAEAYIGPGIGAGTVGIVLGILGSVFLALFVVVWYPLKRILRKIKAVKTWDSDGAEGSGTSSVDIQLDGDRPLTRPTQDTDKS